MDPTTMMLGSEIVCPTLIIYSYNLIASLKTLLQQNFGSHGFGQKRFSRHRPNAKK